MHSYSNPSVRSLLSLALRTLARDAVRAVVTVVAAALVAADRLALIAAEIGAPVKADSLSPVVTDRDPGGVAPRAAARGHAAGDGEVLHECALDDLRDVAGWNCSSAIVAGALSDFDARFPARRPTGVDSYADAPTSSRAR